MDTISGYVAGHRTEDPNYYVEYFPLSCRPTHHNHSADKVHNMSAWLHCARSRRVTTSPAQPSVWAAAIRETD